MHDYADLHSVSFSLCHWTGDAMLSPTIHNKSPRMLTGIFLLVTLVIMFRLWPATETSLVWPEQVATSSQRRSTWWGPSELQWQNYRIENMPSRTKPLLVFVNTKSGPMLGHMLRRKFLRLLNPLQVGVLLYFACAGP